MRKVWCKKISAIITSEKKLERIIHQLVTKVVDRHAISVQDSPTRISKVFGTTEINLTDIQQSKFAPKKEYFLEDDFGWIVAFSFSIPLFICLVIGIFIIGDVQSVSDNLIYGFLGAVIGGLIGTFLALFVRRHQIRHIKAQESRGGFVLWVAIQSKEQEKAVVHILERYKACEIKCVKM